ncbi:M6 family metalloprotease domain-containing protein [Pelagicoccus sp. NFK12]|uniref:M6 family metalloprotease domain-containing protein n=1 Tax=Pelagicoccus enzymogenes TaxID=2773457 RepID=A0A927IFD9_9BACT|nr:M6 family metalloprotease domain-containing protein [Pelagicoccus enzymogenes]MBD5778006.1 M6 family metalloprotease domain-containing protein [Pelagicoccus enzymogenes]
MSAFPGCFIEIQPDGSEIDLHIHGDEHFHWVCDHDGYTVLKDRGWFVYAERGPNGKLVPSGNRVGKTNPAALGLTRRTLPDAVHRRSNLTEPQQADGTASATGSSASQWQGSLKNLVVMLRFSNHSSRTLPSISDVDILMNEPGGHPTLAPTGSVWDVFQENSYGLLSLESTVTYWVDLPQTEAYYAGGSSGLASSIHGALRSALDVINADPNFNFTDFDQNGDGNIDAITFLHSGYAAEWGGTSADGAYYTDRIWSHKWSLGSWYSSEGVRVSNYHISPAVWGTSGSTIGRIGVICHETGHFLGLPDLYDGDDSNGDGKRGNGLGSWCLMANSWGFDNSQRHPPHLSAWSKTQLGWMTPAVIDSAGTYTLTQAETAPHAFRIDNGYPSGEYLLIENRQPVGIESAMPQGGLAIFHIDETASYTNETHHYRVALLQADGARDLERGADRGDAYDMFRAGYRDELSPSTNPSTNSYQGGVDDVTNNRIYNISSPGTDMTFSFEIIGADAPPSAPNSLTSTSQSYDRISLSWADSSSDEHGFKIERSIQGGSWTEIASTSANITSYQDSGLQPDTSYAYRVKAYNLGGSSAYSNTSTVVTDQAPPPPAAASNVSASALSNTQIAINWSDNASDESGYYVDCSLDNSNWSQIATLGVNATSYVDSSLNASTQYFYRVRAYSSWGQSISGVASATTSAPPPFVFALASQDWAVSGNVSGSYLATRSADGVSQKITEVESGGKPSNRHSYLDHRWQFDGVRGGLMVTLSVKASAPANSEGDNFEFQYSNNGGSSWNSFSPALVVENGTSSTQVGELPDTISGTVYIRVIDTDNTKGARISDSVSIDELFIRTDIDANDFPPEVPTGISASLSGNSSVSLSWADNAINERGYEVLRSANGSGWQTIASLASNTESFNDDTVSPNTSYTYRVSAYSVSFESLSASSNTVKTPDGLTITGLSGGKSKGEIYVDIRWEGGSSLNNVAVYRSVNGGTFTQVISTTNDGAYRDNLGLKGSHSIEYYIASPDGSVTSATVTTSL